MKPVLSAAMLAVALLLLAAAPARAAESYDACTATITALPYTASAPGTYCLKQDLAPASSALPGITINANDVTIDCNGFRIDGTGGGPATTAKGIFANARSGVTVRNCSIRGFQYGVALLGAGSSYHLVEHNRVSGSTLAGLHVEGDGSLVRDNQISLVGGGPSANAFGIFTRYTVDITGNAVSSVAAAPGQDANVIGIYTLANFGGTVSDNRIHGLVKGGATPLRGILNAQSNRVAVWRNTVVGDASAGGAGITCSSTTSRVRDNIIGGFPTALQSCGNAGLNDATP